MMYEQGERRTTSGVRTEALVKRFGDVTALAGVDLDAPAGRVLGLLGHNGAGKTTMLRILTTLATPTSGRAWVGGHDVAADPAAVRACIGLAGQASTVDDLLSARKNLEMIGHLYHLRRPAARARAEELLALVALADVADKLVKTFSGGMRRRLDLAAALVASPAVLFLDEPTTGLDPHARNELWALLRKHVAGGATLVLTTQYLDEADRLADDIVVLDHGAVVARGTPAALKAAHGGDRLAIALADPALLAAARAAVAPFIATSAPSSAATTLAAAIAAADELPPPDPADVAAGRLVIPLRAGVRLVEVVRALDAAGIDATDIARRDATLDDVFLSLTPQSSQTSQSPRKDAA
jgi:ABC-2 type transport system ATP-binding protein